MEASMYKHSYAPKGDSKGSGSKGNWQNGASHGNGKGGGKGEKGKGEKCGKRKLPWEAGSDAAKRAKTESRY